MLRVIIFAKAKAAVLLDSEDVGLPISLKYSHTLYNNNWLDCFK